jgi:hypothetical protein
MKAMDSGQLLAKVTWVENVVGVIEKMTINEQVVYDSTGMMDGKRSLWVIWIGEIEMMVGAETILELLDHLEKPGGFSPNRRKILRLMAGAIGFYGADWCCAWLYLKKKLSMSKFPLILLRFFGSHF